MREIKFRAWNPQGDMLSPFSLGDTETNIKYIIDEKWPIMQYTGLKDKNGKEIYEGDVVHFPDGSSIRYEVKWDNERGGWAWGKIRGNLDYKTATENLEVIGNIHENPELLTNN